MAVKLCVVEEDSDVDLRTLSGGVVNLLYTFLFIQIMRYCFVKLPIQMYFEFI